LVSTKLPPNNVHKGQFHSSQTHKQLFSHFFIPSLFLQSAVGWQELALLLLLRGGGNCGPIFTDYEINNFLDIMGDVMPIGPLEWALVVDRHKVLFGSKSRDMQSLRCKFNALAGTMPPTGDAVIPPIVQKAKDVQRAIKIKMDSGGVGIQDLGIDGGGVGSDGDGGVGFEGDVDPGLDGVAESEEEEDEAAEEAAGVGANLANEFGINKEQLRNELRHTPVDDNTV
jgi:hypothetical protein